MIQKIKKNVSNILEKMRPLYTNQFNYVSYIEPLLLDNNVTTKNINALLARVNEELEGFKGGAINMFGGYISTDVINKNYDTSLENNNDIDNLETKD